MFSLFALAENSPSFDSFLAISPSLWWDNESLAEDWIEWLNSYAPNTYKTAFVTMANEKTSGEDGLKMHNQYLSYKAQLKGRGKFKIDFMDLFEEDHLSTVTPALHHGLKYLYQNWDLDKFYTSNDFDGLKESLKVLSEIYHFNVAPNYAQLVNMGSYFHNKKDYKTAIDIYELGLNTYPEGLQMNGFAAQAYLKDGQISKAKEYFNKGLNLAISKHSPMISWFKDQLNGL
jgi:tetratricopeptide (TPR) repeat protein